MARANPGVPQPRTHRLATGAPHERHGPDSTCPARWGKQHIHARCQINDGEPIPHTSLTSSLLSHIPDMIASGRRARDNRSSN